MKEGSSLFILPGNPQFGRNRFEEIQGKKELKYNNNSFSNRIRYNFHKNNSWKIILRVVIVSFELGIEERFDRSKRNLHGLYRKIALT